MSRRLNLTVLGRQCTLSLSETVTGYWVLFLRLLAGWWFLHAGVRKYTTPGEFSAGWFLEQRGTVVSPILTVFAVGVTEAAVNVLVPLGELLIGVGLLLGLLTRLASYFGASMMFFLYFGTEQWRRGFVNGELLGLVLFLTLVVFGAGRVLGVDQYLEDTDFVESNRWLRYVLG
ncbi:MAG: DoxX family membrane protein [Halobaculum sp.]